MISEITLDESKRLIALEGVITKGLNSFIEVGEALLEIRDSRLYRIEHGTFEEYCRDKWKMSRRQANRLVGGATVVNNLGPIGPKTEKFMDVLARAGIHHNNDATWPSPKTEGQVRPLTRLPANQQPEAWAKALEAADGNQPTAKQVEAAVVELLAPSPISPEEPASTEEKIKIVINQALRIWGMAKMTLDTIAKDDASKVEALNEAIKYCNDRINNKK
jgi:hypothetical protein